MTVGKNWSTQQPGYKPYKHWHCVAQVKLGLDQTLIKEILTRWSLNVKTESQPDLNFTTVTWWGWEES